jgi:two-component system NtrC family response regulator
VLQIRIPPLRERRADIVPLAEHFLAQASDPPRILSEDARHVLQTYSWPGNVRELKNVVERASVHDPPPHLTVVFSLSTTSR